MQHLRVVPRPAVPCTKAAAAAPAGDAAAAPSGPIAAGLPETAAVDRLAVIRRLPLLVRAARFGLADYDRSRTLARIFRGTTPGRPGTALDALIAAEAAAEDDRRAGTGAYQAARHVELLIAMMAEARLADEAAAARVTQRPGPDARSGHG